MLIEGHLVNKWITIHILPSRICYNQSMKKIQGSYYGSIHSLINVFPRGFTRAFTLIELLVVIAIIGVLASIVLASLSGARNRGKDTRIISDIHQLRTQIENDRTTTDYTNSFAIVPLSATVNFGSGTLTQYAAVVSDAKANSSITTATASSTYKGATKIAGNDYSTSVASSPEIVVNENGTAVNGLWTLTPTAYSIWGLLSTGNWFCLDSAGNSKNGTSANPTTITCQ